MADSNTNNNTILLGGISTTEMPDYTVDDLAPNNYLTIVWHNSEGKIYNSLDINDKQAVQYTVDLNNALEQGINNNNVSYAGQNKYINLETLAKYISQNTIPAGTQRTVINSLIGLLSGSKESLPESTKNLIVNVFGEVAEKTARKFGLTDPHELFASFANENTIKLFTELGNKTKDFFTEKIKDFSIKKVGSLFSKTKDTKQNKDSEFENATPKQYVGLLLGLTTSDTESYDFIIPRKKVEYGTDYTTHIITQPFKKDFNVILTNKVLSSDFNRITEIENIEKVKNKLIEIGQSKIPFDIYIRLSSNKCYKKSNVYFTSLSFSKDENSGDGYTCSFSIEPINVFKTKLFVSDRKYFPKPSKDSSGHSGSGGSGGYGSFGGGSGISGGGNGNNNNGDITSDGNPITVGHVYGQIKTQEFKTFNDMVNAAIMEKSNIIEIQGDTVDYRFTNNAVVAVRTSKVVRTVGKEYTYNYIAAGSILAQPEDCVRGNGSDMYPNSNFYYLKNSMYVDSSGYIHNGKKVYKIVSPRKLLKK